MGPLIAHLLGDYVLQNSWMAMEKTKQTLPCLVHVLVYALCFVVFLQPSAAAIAVIAGTHFIIDRFRLARYVIWAREQVAPRKYQTSWKLCSSTGYSPQKPQWMSFWLLVIVDNTMHLLINHLALTYL